MKKYGQDLKAELIKLEIDLKNTHNEINKRFDLTLSKFSEYITEDDKKYLHNHSIHDLDYIIKCNIMARTDNEYIKKNSNQLNLFN